MIATRYLKPNITITPKTPIKPNHAYICGPGPGNVCKKSNPIKLNVNSGVTRIRRTHPVASAPQASQVIRKPKKTRNTMSALLSILVKRSLLSDILQA